MKRFLLIVIFIGIAGIFAFAQSQYTIYDDFPGVDKIYKPAFDSSFSGWKRMLYEYPINFAEINKNYSNYSLRNPNEKTAIIRYYKIWEKAISLYAKTTGEIVIPDLKNLSKNLFLKQKNTRFSYKSVSTTNSNWSFLGPKETFWLNEENIHPDRIDSNGAPKQCPWQVNVYSFDVANSDENILYCGTETGFVNKSTDKGLSWNQMGKSYLFGGSVPAVAVHPSSADTVYVSAGNQLHKTNDGGNTWAPLLEPDDAFSAVRLKINNVNPKNIIAASSDGFFVTNDAGLTWNKKWDNPVYDVEFNTADPSIIYLIAKNLNGKFEIAISKNGGDSFEIDTNFPKNYTESSGGLLAVTAANPNLLYATLLASEDEEKVPFILKAIKSDEVFTWQETKKGEYQSAGGLTGFTNGQGYFDLILEASPNNENLIFWGTCSLWKSSDGGFNFTRIGGYGGNFPIHPDIQDMKILSSGDTWVSTDGGMNLSTDYFTDTKNYSSRTQGIIGSDMWGFDQGWNEDIVVGGRYHNGNTAISDFYGNKALRLGGAESATGWVIQGKSRHVVFKDLGNGWILPKTAEGKAEGRFVFSKHPNMDDYGRRRSNLVHHPNYFGTIYVGEGNGIWESNNFGESFELLYQFQNRIRFLQISYKNPDVLYADILGFGLYRSSDGGKSWEQKPSLTDGSFGDSSWNGNLFFVISPYNENKIYVCQQNETWSGNIGKVYKSIDGGDSWTDWNDGINEYTKCLVIQPSLNEKDIVYLFTSSKNGFNSKVFSRTEGESSWSSFNENYPAGINVNLALPFYRDGKIRVTGNGGIWESPMLESAFTPLLNPWVEKSFFNCMDDTLYFDDHSILNHTGQPGIGVFLSEPKFISDKNSRHPKVVLGNVGDYDVTLSVSQNDKTYQKTISKMVTTTTCPSINDCNNPIELDKNNWSLVFADSEENFGEDGKATNAFDGDPDTYWHTEWYYNSTNQPHEIQIDLGSEYLLSSFTYLPRQNSSNGWIKDYELYISNDKMNWGNAVKTGIFETGSALKTVTINPTLGKYVKFKSLSEQNDHSFTSVAELSFIGCIDNSNSAKNITEANNLKAFPIPANNKITIDLPQNKTNLEWQYQIVSISGHIINSNKFTSHSSNYTFKIEELNSGIYFIQLKNTDSATYFIKFIKY